MDQLTKGARNKGEGLQDGHERGASQVRCPLPPSPLRPLVCPDPGLFAPSSRPLCAGAHARSRAPQTLFAPSPTSAPSRSRRLRARMPAPPLWAISPVSSRSRTLTGVTTHSHRALLAVSRPCARTPSCLWRRCATRPVPPRRRAPRASIKPLARPSCHRHLRAPLGPRTAILPLVPPSRQAICGARASVAALPLSALAPPSRPSRVQQAPPALVTPLAPSRPSRLRHLRAPLGPRAAVPLLMPPPPLPLPLVPPSRPSRRRLLRARHAHRPVASFAPFSAVVPSPPSRRRVPAAPVNKFPGPTYVRTSAQVMLTLPLIQARDSACATREVD
ncbi:hypothetical protein DENSPDRAFT_886550 [Dentipellis sp. KUC8613]|nr:hypothetical protein DENSPDRAFT_886550 [Dentipellis sp. KUC8613]